MNLGLFFFKGHKSLWPSKAVCKQDARLQPGILLHTALELSELAEAALGACGVTSSVLSWEQHLGTSSPQPSTVVTPCSTRVQPHTHTCVHTHPCSLGSSLRNAARKGLWSVQLPSRFSGHIDPDLFCVRLTPAPPWVLLGSSQKQNCCGSAPLPWHLWRAKLAAKTL